MLESLSMEKLDFLKKTKEIAKKRNLSLKIGSVIEEGDKLVFFISEEKDKEALTTLRDDLKAVFGREVSFRVFSARDKAKSIGGLGPCGQVLCCKRWLTQPLNTPLKTLAEQRIEGSPAKFLGACGNLMCCLLYEAEGFKCPVKEALTEKATTSQTSQPSQPITKAVEQHGEERRETSKKKIRRLVLGKR